MDDVAIDLTSAQIQTVETALAKNPQAALDQWWAQAVPNSAVSRDTARYNRAFAAFRALRAIFD
jgi:hypothetical protein